MSALDNRHIDADLGGPAVEGVVAGLGGAAALGNLRAGLHQPGVVLRLADCSHYIGLSDKYRDSFSANVLTWGLSNMLT